VADDAENGQDFPMVLDEQLVKSPPEPTRVKSPEQVVLRSPEPVNWTVPLDTGKTFTVTQNIQEGKSLCYPMSSKTSDINSTGFPLLMIKSQETVNKQLSRA